MDQEVVDVQHSDRPVEPFLSDFQRREVCVPPFTVLLRYRCNILHDHVGDRQDLLQLLENPNLCVLPGKRARRHAIPSFQPVVEPGRSASAVPEPSRSPHGSPDLYCLFDMLGCLRHTVDDGFLGSDHRPALERTAGIDPDNQLLVVRLYDIGQNDAEDADLIPVRSGFSLFQEQP